MAGPLWNVHLRRLRSHRQSEVIGSLSGAKYVFVQSSDEACRQPQKQSKVTKNAPQKIKTKFLKNSAIRAGRSGA